MQFGGDAVGGGQGPRVVGQGQANSSPATCAAGGRAGGRAGGHKGRQGLTPAAVTSSGSPLLRVPSPRLCAAPPRPQALHELDPWSNVAEQAAALQVCGRRTRGRSLFACMFDRGSASTPAPAAGRA